MPSHIPPHSWEWKCDFRVALLARTFPSLCRGCEPKARVVTNSKVSTWSRNFNWSSTYSWTTWNFQGRNSRCCKCNFWKSQNHLEKDCRSTCFCWKWTMECSKHEKRISCQIWSYFNNWIVITFDLANKGQPINWCSILLILLLVESTRWTECQKRATTNPISSKTKADSCYLRLIIDILFRKWFLLSKVPSVKIITPKEPMSPTNQEC